MDNQQQRLNDDQYNQQQSTTTSNNVWLMINITNNGQTQPTMITCKHYSSIPTEQQTRWLLHVAQSSDKPPEPIKKPLQQAENNWIGKKHSEPVNKEQEPAKIALN
jgi:hypothetical protein